MQMKRWPAEWGQWGNGVGSKRAASRDSVGPAQGSAIARFTTRSNWRLRFSIS
jgi:hypothetical protein